MEILKTVYEEVTTLESWLKNVTDLDIDNEAYLTCLKEFHNIYLAFASCRKFFKPVSLSQHSHQYEIILRTVQKILKKKGPGQNVLTFGFSRISEGSTGQIWQNIESRYLNSSVKLLQATPWRQLLNWIGDEMMLYILEHMSIFLEVKPSCFVQLTGTPIYEMWSFDTKSTLKLHKDWQRNYGAKNFKKRELDEQEIPQAKRRKTSQIWRNYPSEGVIISQTDSEKVVNGGHSEREASVLQPNMVLQEERNLTFKPFDSKLLLPRNKLLYNVNIRERSASMMKHKPTLDGVLALYTDIFINSHEEGIKNNKVIVPSLSTTEIETVLREETADGDGNLDEIMETAEHDADGETTENTRSSVYVTVSNGQRQPVGSLFQILPLLKKFLQNARKFPYKVLANKHCPAHTSITSQRRPAKAKVKLKKKVNTLNTLRTNFQWCIEKQLQSDLEHEIKAKVCKSISELNRNLNDSDEQGDLINSVNSKTDSCCHWLTKNIVCGTCEEMSWHRFHWNAVYVKYRGVNLVCEILQCD